MVPTLVLSTDGDDGLFADVDELYEGRIVVADSSTADGDDNYSSQSLYVNEMAATAEQHAVSLEDCLTAEQCFKAGGSRAPMLFESNKFNATIFEWIESRV